ncbi:MAG TPA: M50 family metallopeptidase [Streptosporangiaceae bacterium]|nr:M50 family metallopeptidase [Streptosporangiaceae bacterium]
MRRDEFDEVNMAGVGVIWHRLAAAQHLPPSWLVAVSGLLALAAVAPRRAWLVSRNAVTIAHEGGHALVALMTGRRLAGVRLHRSTAGETISAGKPAGPGMMCTAAAGYTAPSLLGLGAAALLAAGHPAAMLLISLVLLAALTLAMRNGYGLAAVLVAGLTVLAVCWFASPLVQAVFAYSLAWFLLLGSVRPVVELQRTRRRGLRATDADELARLTGVPGLVWVGMFGIVVLAALAFGADLLIR